MHLTPWHSLLLIPVIALVGTPLYPFVNSGAVLLGLPVMMLWVAGWGVATTLILALLYRHEPELADPADDAADDADAAVTGRSRGEVAA
ncbi:hypothetical protein Csp1_02510 [Corynebacterium provencense]|uniref:DUF3311 domain-containing protein n=1 Tax=Corynebacterium provencense TaxID=1737425 RepID=A0A2Z3YSQ9_9CORY|nr:DUF3311 domain-containing protein [Corynebacterium provencense]AWT25077.1 hypothetical protein Csp1_02510 [Corynebacterium provencense]